jgi:hypothetical protein
MEYGFSDLVASLQAAPPIISLISGKGRRQSGRVKKFV